MRQQTPLEQLGSFLGISPKRTEPRASPRRSTLPNVVEEEEGNNAVQSAANEDQEEVPTDEPAVVMSLNEFHGTSSPTECEDNNSDEKDCDEEERPPPPPRRTPKTKSRPAVPAIPSSAKSTPDNNGKPGKQKKARSTSATNRVAAKLKARMQARLAAGDDGTEQSTSIDAAPKVPVPPKTPVVNHGESRQRTRRTSAEKVARVALEIVDAVFQVLHLCTQ